MAIRIEIDFDPSKGETLADYVAALQVFGEIGEAPWAPPRARRAELGAAPATGKEQDGAAAPIPIIVGQRACVNGVDSVWDGEDWAPIVEIPNAGNPTADFSAPTPVVATERVAATGGPDPAATFTPPSGPDAPVARVPGHPSPGRKKRTSAEVAEDEAYFAEHGKVAAAPEPPPVAPEAQAQDAADEAAESEPAAALTLDDLRKAVGKYATRFGLPAAVKDIPALLGCPLAQVPPEGIAAAIATVMNAVEGPSPLAAAHAAGSTFVPGPGGLELNAAPDSAPTAVAESEPTYGLGPRVWSQDDFLAAVTDYAARFDGAGVKLAETKFARFDAPEVLKRTFGPAVSNLKTVPNDSASWERATAAMRAAIDANPFKRAVVS